MIYPSQPDIPNPEVTKPKNALYLFNFEIRPYLLCKPLIIGKIDIEVNESQDQLGMEPAPPAEPVPVDPAVEGLYRVMGEIEKSATDAIEEAKNESIKAVKKANKESTKLSYTLLIVGALFGILGSLFISSLFKTIELVVNPLWYPIYLVVSATAISLLIIIIGRKSKK